jgi:3-oxoadipate enol-lactonase
LCNTAAKIGTTDSWNTRIAAIENGELDTIVPAVLGRWFTDAFIDSNPIAIARTRASLEAVDIAGYIASCIALRDADLRNEIKRIQVPVLVIAGTHDPATTPSEGRYLANEISHSQFLELNASHMSNIEAADEFNTAVMEFLLS